MRGWVEMMNLVLLANLLGIVLCLPWNHPQQVQDTPEVAAAKAAHLAAVAKAKQEARVSRPAKPKGKLWNEYGTSRTTDQPWTDRWNDNRSWGQVSPHAPVADDVQKDDDGSWNDDGSWMNYDDGEWEDDMNVIRNDPVVHQDVADDQNKRWTGPIALPPGYDETGAPLPVEDTPEVAAAKAKHLLSYARAASVTPASSRVPSSQAARGRPVAYFTPVASENPPARTFRLPSPAPRRNAPALPAPVWESNGVLDDTPEVAAAKAAHFAAHAKRRKMVKS